MVKCLLMRVGIIVLFVMTTLALWAEPSHPHPHVFIETVMEIEMGDRGVAGIWHHWTFDEYFSAWIADGYDRNRDGLFSAEETGRLYQEAFQNVKEYGFWTRVFAVGGQIPVERLKEFSAEIVNDKVRYSFFLPLDIPVEREVDILIAVYDEEFYCQIFFPPDEVGFKGNLSGWKIHYTTQKMPELAYYFGFVIPVAVMVSIAPS